MKIGIQGKSRRRIIKWVMLYLIAICTSLISAQTWAMSGGEVTACAIRSSTDPFKCMNSTPNSKSDQRSKNYRRDEKLNNYIQNTLKSMKWMSDWKYRLLIKRSDLENDLVSLLQEAAARAENDKRLTNRQRCALVVSQMTKDNYGFWVHGVAMIEDAFGVYNSKKKSQIMAKIYSEYPIWNDKKNRQKLRQIFPNNRDASLEKLVREEAQSVQKYGNSAVIQLNQLMGPCMKISRG